MYAEVLSTSAFLMHTGIAVQAHIAAHDELVSLN